MNVRKVYCNQLFYENLKRPLHFDIFALTSLYDVRFFLEFTCQIWYNYLYQTCNKSSFSYGNLSQTPFSEKYSSCFASLMKYFIVLSRNYCEGDSAFFRHVVVLSTCFLELTKRLFCFASAASRREGRAPKCLPRSKITLSLLKTCKTCKPSNALSPKPFACLNMLVKIPSSFWHLLYNFPSK